MRRADRLFQLVQLIRGRRLSTAAFLADRLEVSVRTVYRDVGDLQAQGVPIDGEAGVGYRMYWGEAWTLAAWCELRQDFRSFRVDRIESLQTLDERFRDEPGRTLADLQRRFMDERGDPG